MKPDGMITRIVTGFPKTTLFVFLLLAVLAALQLPNLTRDPTPYLLPPDHESRVNLSHLRRDYTGANDGIIVLLESEQTVFTPQTLARVQNLTRAFEQIHVVTPQDRQLLLELSDAAPPAAALKIKQLANAPVTPETWMQIDEIRERLDLEDTAFPELTAALDEWIKKLSPVIEVTSLSSADNIRGKDGILDINPVFETVPRTEQELADLKKAVMSNRLFDNILVSENGKSTGIIIELIVMDNRTQEQFQVYQQVKSIVEQQFPGPERHYIAGLPVVSGALGKIMERDTQRLFPIVILIVTTCLFLTFRKLKGILVPLGVVILSLIVTLGLKVLFDIPLNIITTTLPVFILSIGVADGIHMFSEYRDHLLLGDSKVDAIKKTMKQMTMPVIMTSVTTAVAFYAISLTEIVQLHHFGLFVAAGAMIAMLYSLFFIPALLMLLPERKIKSTATAKPSSRIETAYAAGLVKTTEVFVRRPVITAVAAAIVFGVSLFGASKVVVDNNNALYFLEGSDIRVSSEKLNKDAAGSALINFLVTFEKDEPEPFKHPENLKYIEQLVDFLNQQPQVGKVMGLTELIKRINFVLHDEDPVFNRVPSPDEAKGASRHMISQMLLLYENGGGDTLSDFTDTGYTRINIPAVIQTNSSQQTLMLSRQVRHFVNQTFPAHIRVDITGSASVSVAATDEIVKGQMTSLFVSLGVVLAMLFITFRKLTYAGIAMVPLVMTIAVNFAIMGFFNIPLDIGTAIISSIVIGIGVDYAIHYLSRLKSNLDRGEGFLSAMENTVSHSGKAIVSNAATVGFGFVALLFSALTPLIIMGWMITVTMLISAFCTLVLIPVLLVLVERRPVEKRVKAPVAQLAFQPQKIKP